MFGDGLAGTAPRVAIVAPSGPTRAASFTWRILFDKPVSGLTAGDFTKTGSADHCSIGTPSTSNGGTAWSMTVSSCSAGTLRLTIRAGAVAATSEVAPRGPAVATKSAATLRIDRTRPHGTTPAATPWVGAPLSGSSIPVKLAWDAASDAGGAGVMRYDIARSTNGGDSWTLLGSGQPTYAAINQAASGSIRYKVRPVDWAGNKGAWVESRTYRPRIAQQTSPNAAFSSGWTTLNDIAFSGGSARQSDVQGASARYRFTGRAIGLVMSTDPTLGVVKVYIDGDLRKTVDMADFDAGDKVVVYARRFSTLDDARDPDRVLQRGAAERDPRRVRQAVAAGEPGEPATSGGPGLRAPAAAVSPRPPWGTSPGSGRSRSRRRARRAPRHTPVGPGLRRGRPRTGTPSVRRAPSTAVTRAGTC